LKVLLAANKRLNTAYVLKESFGQLWSYEREGWARRFFENWRASLKWQRKVKRGRFWGCSVRGNLSRAEHGKEGEKSAV
jgi:transposase